MKSFTFIALAVFKLGLLFILLMLKGVLSPRIARAFKSPYDFGIFLRMVFFLPLDFERAELALELPPLRVFGLSLSL